MKNDYKYHWYRRIRTRNEMRANCLYYEDGERQQWGRPSRSKWKLDPRSNEPRHTEQKSWKKKRKTQYRVGARQEQERKFQVDTSVYEWYIDEYFEKHDIPYRKVKITKREYRRGRWEYQRRQDKESAKWGILRFEYKWVLVDPDYEYYVTKRLGYTYTYWSNKVSVDDIIQYVVQTSPRWRF